ncbi:unnamed protein product, partial [Laminaria digitata]
EEADRRKEAAEKAASQSRDEFDAAKAALDRVREDAKQVARKKQAAVRAAELHVQQKGETAVASEAAFRAETAVAQSVANDWKESRLVREALGREILKKEQTPRLVKKPPPAHDPENKTLRTINPRQGPVNGPGKVAAPTRPPSHVT